MREDFPALAGARSSGVTSNTRAPAGRAERGEPGWGIAWVHDAPLVALALMAACELIGAALTVKLAAMTDKQDRPRDLGASAHRAAPWRPRVSCERLNGPGPP